MRVGFTVLFVGIVIVGCSHSYDIRSLDSEEYRWFERSSSRGACVIVLDDRTKYDAKNAKLSADTTTWFATATGVETEVPSQQVLSIAFVDRSDGAVEGVGVGFAVGFLIGGLVGYMSGSEECSGSGSELSFCFTRGESLVLGGFLFAVPAALIGALIGAERGSTYIYYPFPDDSMRGSDNRVDRGPEG